MKNLFKNKIFIALIIVAVIAVGAYFVLNREDGKQSDSGQGTNVSQSDTNSSGDSSGGGGDYVNGIDSEGNADEEYNNMPGYKLPKSDDPESQKDAPPPLLPGSTLDDQEEYEKKLKEWAEKWGDGKKVERLDKNGNPTGEYLSGEGDSIPFDKRFASWRYNPGTNDANQWATSVFRKEADDTAYAFIKTLLAHPRNKSKWIKYIDDYYLRQDMLDKPAMYENRDFKRLKVINRGYSDMIYEVVFNDPKRIGNRKERIRFVMEMQGIDPKVWKVTRFIREAV